MGVDERYQQRGVGTARMREMASWCDHWLQVSRMALALFVDNRPAIALYQRVGFEIEITAKGFAMRHGERVDAHYMAQTRACRVEAERAPTVPFLLINPDKVCCQ